MENCRDENTCIYGCLNYFFVNVPHSNLFYLMTISLNSMEQHFSIDGSIDNSLNRTL